MQEMRTKKFFEVVAEWGTHETSKDTFLSPGCLPCRDWIVTPSATLAPRDGRFWRGISGQAVPHCAGSERNLCCGSQLCCWRAETDSDLVASPAAGEMIALAEQAVRV